MPSCSRQTVTRNLQAGTFQLVIAVDAITDELKRIVEYLNEHTDSDVPVLALELSYVRDVDVEILFPAIYGEEPARKKTAARGARAWDEASFRAAVTEYVPSPQRDRLLAVVDHALSHNSPTNFYWGASRFYWGSGRYPSAGAWFKVGEKDIPVWSIYTDPAKTVFVLNFEWMRNKGVTVDVLRRTADRMRGLPGVAPLHADLEAKAYGRRPSLPVKSVFEDASAPIVIAEAIDLVMSAGLGPS